MKARKLNAAIRAGYDRAAELEPKLAAAYERAIGAAGRRTAEAFLAKAVDHDAVVAAARWTPPQLAEVLDEAALAADAVEKTKGTQRQMLKSQVGDVLGTAGISWTVKHPLSQALLDGLAARAVDIGEGMREPIAQAIADGLAQGKTVPQTAQAIRAAVDGLKGWQATMLARNDLIGVSNGGGLMTARMLHAADEKSAGYKTWMTAADGLVRPAHVAASGQTVKLDQPFAVGSSMLMYPGDPAGAHGDVVNCRCVQLFEDGPAVRASAQPPPARVASAPVKRTRKISEAAQLALDGTMPECGHLVAAADDQGDPIGWTSEMTFENFGTDDGRWFEAGCWEWRDLPLTLMAMIETTEGGHLGAQVAGRIDTIKKGTKGEAGRVPVLAEGIFDSGEYGAEIARLVGDKTLRGISVDYAVEEWAIRDPETGEIIPEEDMTENDWERLFWGELDFAVTKATIMAATVCPTPAFGDATIAITAGGVKVGTIWCPIEIRTELSGMTAAAAGLAPLHPPAEWFDDPQLDAPTPLTITEEGRVFGHLALWDSCHIGEPSGAGICTSPPHSATGYAYFHLGEVETAEGHMVSAGKITFDTGHASLRASRAAATKHYDDTGAVGADVRAGEDEHGIYVAGALRPDVPAEDVRLMRAATISGDWRRVGGNLEMVAALAVNVPGYPVPRVAALVEPVEIGAEVELQAFTLVAAGIVGEPDLFAAHASELEALGMLAGVVSEG